MSKIKGQGPAWTEPLRTGKATHVDAHKNLGSRLANAQERGEQLRARAARAASHIASTEEDGADLYQTMAEQREDYDPEHAERLRAMSAEARAFAATEREASPLPE